jgi:hypothetical protein
MRYTSQAAAAQAADLSLVLIKISAKGQKYRQLFLDQKRISNYEKFLPISERLDVLITQEQLAW